MIVEQSNFEQFTHTRQFDKKLCVCVCERERERDFKKLMKNEIYLLNIILAPSIGRTLQK